MKVGEILVRPPVTVWSAATVADVAQTMAREGVGSVIVLDGERLVGIVTDRDLVVRAMAKGFPNDARADSVMSMNVVAIDVDADVRDAMKAFGHHAVRRLPVVRGTTVAGLLSLDDLVAAMANQFSELTHGLTAQLMYPHGSDEPKPPALR